MKDTSISANQGDLEKTATGPDHIAPENPSYKSSFDEFAGTFVRDDAVLLGDRDEAVYPENRDAYEFGCQMAERFTGREWSDAQSDVHTEWSTNHDGDWSVIEPQVQEGWRASRGLG